MRRNPLILVDYYKTEHHRMMPVGTTKLYSNFTPRKSRIEGVDSVVFFGMQYFIVEYLIKEFNENFFGSALERSHESSSMRDGKLAVDYKKYDVLEEYKRHIKLDSYKHIEDLWDLGYLPIEIKALPEGTLCPIGVPCFTITNTNPEFSWLVNYLETLISCMMWQPITSATIAHEYKKLLTKWAIKTGGDMDFVPWQGHDFSMRGMSSPESSVLSGMGHLLSFTGTDTIPAIYALEKVYKAEGLIGGSIPATEHSIQCMHYDFETGSEDSYIKHLIKTYPNGPVAMVSDGFNLWDMITKTLPKHKESIMARDGKLVIRPDSGDPVKILTGYTKDEVLEEDGKFYEKGRYVSYKDSQGYEVWGGYDKGKELSLEEVKGVTELLWDLFGGTVNEKGFRVLDSHIGAIYGDSITLGRAREICERLHAKGFASTNVVLGIGSYTYQYNTRDTFGFAMKATYGEITHKVQSGSPAEATIAKEIYKDPITDDGTKKSKKGLLCVDHNGDGKIQVFDQVNWAEEKSGMLQTVFKDGKLVVETTLAEIRECLNS
jgi:nicotinamide phosphoribosyltransferase